jgi:4-hydroxysphinganine ceramide fatty acyl 2-hydroxylase
MAKNFVSNSQESVRMFKSSFLESLSKVHYFVPIIIFVPVILVCSYFAYDRQIGVLNYWLFLAGLFVWTLTEYIMHRFVFHFVPKKQNGFTLALYFPRCTSRLSERCKTFGNAAIGKYTFGYRLLLFV